MKRVWDIIGRKQATVSSAATILISMVFASRVLGLLRDRLLSARFAPDELGVYFAAFRIPNLLFELLVMGAFTSAFIPVFTKHLAQKEEAKGWEMTSILMNITFILFCAVAIPLYIWTERISQMLAPGFSHEQVSQMAQFTRFMIIFQVLPLLIGNFYTGLLQSYHQFFLPAAAPVVYNVGIILGIVLFSSQWGLYAPIFGIGIGSFLFMCIQLPLLVKKGFRHSWIIDVKNKGVREVGRLIGPRTFGLAVSQIDTTVDLMLASLLGARMVTIFNFAQHLQQLPIGLFGASIAQAALPTLSNASVKADLDEFKKTIIRSIHQVLFFVLPISVFFIVLRIPIVRLIFGAARFDWQATVLTGITLSAFSVSLFAQSLVHILARGFYALYDTKTPVMISVVSIIINTVLSIVCIQYLALPVWSLGMSTSVASIVNMICLLILLDKHIKGFHKGELFIPALKMVIASITAGFAIYVPLKIFDQLVFDTTRTIGLVLLTGTAGFAGLLVYLMISWLFNIGEVMSFFALIKRLRGQSSVLLEPAQEVEST